MKPDGTKRTETKEDKHKAAGTEEVSTRQNKNKKGTRNRKEHPPKIGASKGQTVRGTESGRAKNKGEAERMFFWKRGGSLVRNSGDKRSLD